MATETGSGVSLDLDTLTPVHWVGVVLAVVSGAIHLALGVGFLPSPFGVSFVLAGLGFAGAVALLLVGYRRRLLYGVGIPFTGVQVVLWYLVRVRGEGFPAFGEATLDYVDKAAQVLLILVLAYLLATE
jgi:hypothetical protein